MPPKLRKIPKVMAADDAAIRAVHTRYFCSLGLYGESQPLTPPELSAALKVKFGKAEYRRQAWAQVQDTVKGSVPPWIFEVLDKHFTGAATHFTVGIGLELREKMKAALSLGE